MRCESQQKRVGERRAKVGVSSIVSPLNLCILPKSIFYNLYDMVDNSYERLLSGLK